MLLEKGRKLAAFEKDAKLLEVGCAGGEATEYMLLQGFTDLTGIDIDPDIIREAEAKHIKCAFYCADACRTPFEEENFMGIYSEAAFALIADKAATAKEYFRILKTGGRVLINDFTLRANTESERLSVQGIPMLMGVQTREVYKKIFEEQGFSCIYENEEYPELIRIAISFGKIYNISPAKVGQHIVAAFGRDEYVNDFFSQTQMSYCQMIFKKV